MKKMAFLTEKSSSLHQTKRKISFKTRSNQRKLHLKTNSVEKSESSMKKTPLDSSKMRSGMMITRYSEMKRLFRMTMSKSNFNQCSSIYEQDKNLYKQISDYNAR